METRKDTISKVLGYWALLAFLDQSNQPNPKSEPKTIWITNKDDKKELIRISGCELISIAPKMLSTSLKEHFEREKNALIRKCVEQNEAGGSLKKGGSKKGDPKLEYESIHVHVCKIPRDAVVKSLTDKSELYEREKSNDCISAALIETDGNGLVRNISLSPVMWAVEHKGTPDMVSHTALRQKEAKLLESFTDKAITFNDIRSFIEHNIEPTLKEMEPCFKDTDVRFNDGLGTLIIEYKLSKNPREDFTPATLSNSFYEADINAIRDQFEKVESEQKLLHSSLSTIMQYLYAGFDEDEERDTRRIDVLANNGEYADDLASYYEHSLSHENTPLGRWPWSRTPSLMQQVAINAAVGRQYPANDILSVNGPPGTGKTTLLKDVIAANVVEKARFLSRFDNPDNMFEEASFSKKSGYLQFAKNFYRIKDQYDHVNDFSILLCSSNNTAVENISVDLSKGNTLLDSLDENERAEFLETIDTCPYRVWSKEGYPVEEARDFYFSHIALNQFRKESLITIEEHLERAEKQYFAGDVLISARLGNQENIYHFYRALKSLIDSFPHGTNEKDTQIKRYQESRKKFTEQLKHVEDIISQRSQENHSIEESALNFDAKLKAFESSNEKLRKASRMLTEARHSFENSEAKTLEETTYLAKQDRIPFNPSCFNEIFDEIDDIHARNADYIADYKGLCDEIDRIEKKIQQQEDQLEETSSSFSFLNHLKWSNRQSKRELEKLEHELEELVGQKRRCEEKNRRAIRELQFAENASVMIQNTWEHEATVRKMESAVIKCEDVTNRLKKQYQRAQETYEIARNVASSRHDPDTYAFVDDTFIANIAEKKAQLSNFSQDNELARQKDLLFLYSLQLTKHFILASNAIKSNLENLVCIWGAKGKSVESGNKEKLFYSNEDKDISMPHLMQTLGILCPIISTTFASVGRMFEHVKISAANNKAPFGLLIIDEAGQAVQYSALGALARCRKALVVGDPYQIEPVVPSDLDAIRETYLSSFDSLYYRKCASVQDFADSCSPIGHYRTSENGEKWIGCPLIVHRRCTTPMFEISNEISYGNSMIKMTRELDPDRDASTIKKFFGPSQWFNVSGTAKGGRNRYVEKQGEFVLQIINSAFEKNQNGQTAQESALPSLYVISPFSTVVKGVKRLECPKSANKKQWEKFKQNNIGTVHKFQGKEADEVIFVLGCDSSAKSGVIDFVGSNIVNVAASRAKHRFYVIGDYKIWKQNDCITTMKRILDTAWIPHWKKWRDDRSNIKELKIAQLMLPQGASFPTKNDNDIDYEEWRDNIVDYDAESYCRNVLNCAKDVGVTELISDKECQHFGFNDIKELETTLANCIEKNGSNPILNIVKQGIMQYYLQQEIVQRYPSTPLDWSSSLILFIRAADHFMHRQCLPMLQEICPNEMVRGKEIKKLKEISIGQYRDPIKNNSLTLSQLAKKGSGDISPADSYINKDWWDLFSDELLAAFNNERNNVCHANRSAEPIDEKAVDIILKCLFTGTEGHGYRLFREGEAFQAVNEGWSKTPQSRRENTASSQASTEQKTPHSDYNTEQLPLNYSETSTHDFISPDEYRSLSAWLKRWKENGTLSKEQTMRAARANTILEAAGFLEGKPREWVLSKEAERLGARPFPLERKNEFCLKYPPKAANRILEILLEAMHKEGSR